MKTISLMLNLMIVALEVYTLLRVKGKINILKYYTYLQNFIALAVSAVYSVFLFIHIFFDGEMPEILRGARYVATCGLAVTSFIYTVFLARNDSNTMKADDFTSNFSPKAANLTLHYICPAVALVSFVAFERQLAPTNDIWTAAVAAPSAIYWIAYFILSATKAWQEPYDFSTEKGSGLLNALMIALIPISFVAISFVLWNVK